MFLFEFLFQRNVGDIWKLKYFLWNYLDSIKYEKLKTERKVELEKIVIENNL